jgi:hypothetical protein
MDLVDRAMTTSLGMGDDQKLTVWKIIKAGEASSRRRMEIRI